MAEVWKGKITELYILFMVIFLKRVLFMVFNFFCIFLYIFYYEKAA